MTLTYPNYRNMSTQIEAAGRRLRRDHGHPVGGRNVAPTLIPLVADAGCKPTAGQVISRSNAPDKDLFPTIRCGFDREPAEASQSGMVRIGMPFVPTFVLSETMGKGNLGSSDPKSFKDIAVPAQ